MRTKIITAIVVAAIAGGALYFIAGNDDATTNRVGTNIGDRAPEFAYTTLEGKEVDSLSLRGNVVVITSSAAWCYTCGLEALEFVPVYEKYKDDRVVFITVDIDPSDSKEFIGQFKKNNNTPWDYTNAQGGLDITQKYGFDRFEITYLMDQNGIIRFKDSVITSSDELDAEIQKLL